MKKKNISSIETIYYANEMVSLYFSFSEDRLSIFIVFQRNKQTNETKQKQNNGLQSNIQQIKS